ncbi:MAG TPA: hypothetical protein VFQ65_25050 [Kofleriaceae bacterium]|nr:hypothetical protein [Kofleriaceae bacterium]
MRLLVIALLWGGVAHADDGVHRTLDTADDEPHLQLDPTLRFDPTEGLATYTVERHSSSFVIGPRSRADFEARVWADGFATPGQEPGLTGWSAAGRYDLALAWGIHLEVDASLMKLAPQLDGMFGNGMVAAGGVALTRYFKWGHGRTAWISLGVERTELVGNHATAIPTGTTVGLRVGTTF